MRKITITTYRFSELSPEAQEKAVQDRCMDPYNGEHEGPEAWATANAFNAQHPTRKIVSLCRWERATESDHTEWYHSEDGQPPVGQRAWVWLLHWVHDSFDGVNQYPTLPDVAPLSVNMDWRKAVDVLQGCPLTGVFYDCKVLDPIRKALEGDPRMCQDVDSIFEECGEQLQIALEDAIEWHSSEEANREFLQHCDHEQEFLADGSPY